MGTILVREAVGRILTLMLDASPAFVQCPERTVIAYLNDAQLAIAKFLPMAGGVKGAIKLKAGTAQSISSVAAADWKPQDGSTPSQPILGIALLGITRNMGSDGATPGKVITIANREQLDRQDDSWHLASRASTVVRSYVHNPLLPLEFDVWPPVHASTPVWVTAEFNAAPLKIPAGGAPGAELYDPTGSSTETIKLRDEFIDDLVNYTVARLHMQDSDWADATKASFFEGLFLNSLNAKVLISTGTNPNLKRLPFAPDPQGRAA